MDARLSKIPKCREANLDRITAIVHYNELKTYCLRVRSWNATKNLPLVNLLFS